MLPNNLRALRDKAGYTQHELAAAANISATVPSQIENVLRVPSLPVALRIASVLGCTIEDIWPNPYVISEVTVTVVHRSAHVPEDTQNAKRK